MNQIYSQKNCIVTGGAGFIGSHTCEALLRLGYTVTVIDSFNDYYEPAYKRENVACIQKTASELGGQFFVCEGDIRDRAFLNAVFEKAQPDMVIHLAACAGVRPSIIDPMLYTDVNINGTVNILECLKKYNVKKLLFASSSSVYGNNEKVPFSEADFVDRPISPYAATKKASELICHTYHHLYDINTACLRFFTVYGPRQRPDLAIYKFTKMISEGKQIPFYGDGTTERDYTFIADIVDGIVKAAKWVDSSEKRFDVFNLGESNTITLTRMVNTISDALGIQAILDRQPMQPGDVNRTNADITHSRAILGYDPTIEFEKGIEVFVDWYKLNRKQ